MKITKYHQIRAIVPAVLHEVVKRKAREEGINTEMLYIRALGQYCGLSVELEGFKSFSQPAERKAAQKTLSGKKIMKVIRSNSGISEKDICGLTGLGRTALRCILEFLVEDNLIYCDRNVRPALWHASTGK